jgi:large subunit ribosomal protein L24
MTQPKLKIKRDDNVVVLTGKDKGRSGKVLRVLPKESRVVVEGVNKIKRHTKPGFGGQAGGIIEREAPLHISNVALADPKDGKPTRVGFTKLKDGTKVRIARRSGETINA